MNQPKRKMMWDRGGISEVIGTILTLSITVVLFSSIISMVGQFPAPGDNVYTDFTATIEPVNSTWALGAFIHITNTGGQQMAGLWTLIVISIDDTTYSLVTNNDTLDGYTYGLGMDVYGHRGADNGDGNWDTGERWTLFRSAANITSSSDISAVILDIERNAMVWTGQIQGQANIFGPIISGITADSDLATLRSDPIQFGREYYVFAEVYDPNGDLDASTIRADLSSISTDPTYSSVVMTDPDGDGTYMSGALIGPNNTVPKGYHIATVRASDLSGMNSVSSARISVGLDPGDQPQLVIKKTNILLSSESPVNGQTISIAVTVLNHLGWCNGIVNFYDIIGTTQTLIGMSNFTVSQGPTQVTRSISWIARPGGEHTIFVEAIPIDAVDAEPDDNYNSTDLTVLPKILLVDDDNHAADMTPSDTVSYMRGALESSDFSYDLYTVGSSKDGPGYRLGQMKMKDYDVIVWMTGYEKVKTLTSYDRQNLTWFLNDEDGLGRGGSLWMIGQYVYEDLAVPAAFFQTTLKAEFFNQSLTGPTNPLIGIDGHLISGEWNISHIPMVNRVAGFESSYRVIPAADAEITFKEAGINYTWADAINYENPAKDSRVVFFPWEFTRIANTGDQTQVTYKVLNWLGNISLRAGDDLAISEQTVNPSYVFFNEPVTVDARVRNNGENNLTAQAGLFLDDNIEPILWMPAVTVPGMGSSITISATWNATELGTHVLKWKVDPNNLIPETNEGNNEVPGYTTSGEIFVEFRILIVDDDGSFNNNGTESNDTAFLSASIERLGYTYESPNGENTTYVVPVNSDGPSVEMLKDYSAVIWVAGGAAAALTLNDTAALEAYVDNHRGLLWISGDDLWSNVSGTNLTGSLGINSVNDDMPLSGTMRGMEDSPISHGMNISVASNPLADVLVPNAGASGVFYQSYLTNRFCAVMYDGGTSKTFTTGFNMSTLYGTQAGYLSGDNATDELVYMALHWMEKPDSRVELRITEKDYYISDLHPQIGGAYILRATVHNVGSADANVLVRFMDGTVQIGADSISVSPDTVTSAEIVWTPLFAGSRQISIFVDPINEVDEIFQWFNNNRTFAIYVYFFWDDMESGAAKWSHSATLISINGEGPLDFLTASYTTVNTDVIGSWDWNRTVGVENSTAQYHSYPNSFFMEEPQGYFGAKSDVLVAIVLDNSPSMTDRICPDGTGRTYQRVAKDAAIAMVNEFSNESAVGIFGFTGANEVVFIGITSLAGTGRQDVIDAINDIKEDQGNTNTAIWDAIGLGYMGVDAAKPLYPNNFAAVVSLGDGGDYQAADSSATKIQSIEAGSDEWAPWGNMLPELGYPTSNYPNHWGKYWFYHDQVLPGQWINAGTHGGAWKPNRMGLLNSDLPIYTIGLAIEHYDPPYGNPVSVQPAELVKDTYTHVLNTESGTVEYNFWRIANTSNAEYFYSEDGSNLEDIFTQIGRIINAQGFNQTRSAAPMPLAEDPPENFDKKAVTPSVDISQYDTARFSFWHKYNMLSGGNGGVVGVELWDPGTGTWRFLYIIPSGAYTGGMYYVYDIYDDFGNPIKWCFNGISGQNTYSWDYINVDVMPFIEEQGLKAPHFDADYYKTGARMVLKYLQFGGGTGNGWYIDDVKLDVSRSDGTSISADTKDIWDLTAGGHLGGNCWGNVDPDTGFVRTGLDNSLITQPIDLTNARNAYLSAYFKFNFNTVSGAPPDGFRVEISTDGGAAWMTLNLGIRSSWGISGTGTDSEDGVNYDGRSYTGLTDTYNPSSSVAVNLAAAQDDGYWVRAGSLSRLSIDISPWSGHQVILRFRMVTNNLPELLYPHSNNAFFDPGFGGFYIDDVNVYGETIFG